MEKIVSWNHICTFEQYGLPFSLIGIVSTACSYGQHVRILENIPSQWIDGISPNVLHFPTTQRPFCPWAVAHLMIDWPLMILSIVSEIPRPSSSSTPSTMVDALWLPTISAISQIGCELIDPFIMHRIRINRLKYSIVVVLVFPYFILLFFF